MLKLLGTSLGRPVSRSKASMCRFRSRYNSILGRSIRSVFGLRPLAGRPDNWAGGKAAAPGREGIRR